MSEEPEGTGKGSDRSTLVARLVVFGLLGAIAVLYLVQFYFE
jgi:hypothetical protein